jgi:hypothetical protein
MIMQALIDFFNFEIHKAELRLESLAESLESATKRHKEGNAPSPRAIVKLANEMQREQTYGVFFAELAEHYATAAAKGDMTPFLDECIACLSDEYKNYTTKTTEINAAREARQSLLKELTPFLDLRSTPR